MGPGPWFPLGSGVASSMLAACTWAIKGPLAMATVSLAQPGSAGCRRLYQHPGEGGRAWAPPTSSGGLKGLTWAGALPAGHLFPSQPLSSRPFPLEGAIREGFPEAGA